MTDDLDDLLDSTLDDLDDIAKNRTLPTKPTPPPTTTPKKTTTSTTSTTTTTASSSTSNPQSSQNQDELAEQFAKQMTDILSSLQDGDIDKKLEDLVKNMSGLELPEEAGSSAGESSGSGEGGDEADLSTILSAFAELDQNGNPSESTTASITEQLKKIAENAKTKGNEEAGGEDLEKMLQDFESNPEFQSVMEGMVNQMISKDVLYEPMKELREKYPKWLEDNRATLSDEDYKKYIEQYNIVQKICIVYEGCPENASPDQMQEVVQLMQDMAEYGQPPADIIKDLAPGVQFGPDGTPVFPGVEGGDPANGCSVM